MVFARLQGAYHQKAGTAPDLCKNCRRIFRQPLGRQSDVQIRTQMEIAERQRPQALRLRLAKPIVQLAGYSARDTNHAVGDLCDGFDPIRCYRRYQTREQLRPDQGQHVVRNKDNPHSVSPLRQKPGLYRRKNKVGAPIQPDKDIIIQFVTSSSSFPNTRSAFNVHGSEFDGARSSSV